jgi:DNA-binding FadR family transcriptional regulator
MEDAEDPHLSELFSPLQLISAYELVLRRLRQGIRLGLFLPGDRLPTERALSKQLGVSRVAIREALRVLQVEGEVEVRRGAAGGAIVLDNAPSPEERLANLRNGYDEVVEIVEFRKANEVAAARLAAERGISGEPTDLQESIRRIESSASLAEFRAADSSFHVGIARAAGNALILSAVQRARELMFGTLDALDYELVRDSTANGHREILDAVLASDGRAAADAMTRHLETTLDDIRDILRLTS